MTQEFSIFYTEASIVCIMIFCTFLLNDVWKTDRQEKQLAFDLVLIAHIFYFISDAFWAAVISNQLARTRFLVALLNFLNYVLLSLIAYAWLRYAMAAEQIPWRNKKSALILMRLPGIFMVLLIMILYLIAPTFWVSPAGNLNPLYYPLMLTAPLIYVGATSAFSFYNASKKENANQRRFYTMIALYPIALVTIGITQLVSLKVPLFCFGSSLVMVYFYIQLLEDQISTDPLTRLNNRAQLRNFISQNSGSLLWREDLKTFVVMIDVNNFKKINDTYGHTEGDQALIIIADALRSSIKAFPIPPFLARYGGDEFILIAFSEDTSGLEAFKDLTKSNLEKICKKENTPYSLDLSFGYDELKKGGQDSFQECMKRADQLLYEEKKSTGSGPVLHK